jgi:chromosome segregation ATPase
VSLQSRQEDLDNATAARESSEARLKDLSLQIREAQERAILAEEALADATRSNLASLALQSGSNRDSQDDSLPVALEAANAKAEAKMNELRNDIVKLERERVEMEEEHARQLRNQRTEIERARGQVADKDREVALIASSRKEVEDRLASIEREREMLNHDLEEAQSTLRAAREAQTRASDGEVSYQELRSAERYADAAWSMP